MRRAGAVAAALVAASLAACGSDTSSVADAGTSTTTVPERTSTTAGGLLREEPCSLLEETSVETAVSRSVTASEADRVCTYQADDGTWIITAASADAGTKPSEALRSGRSACESGTITDIDVRPGAFVCTRPDGLVTVGAVIDDTFITLAAADKARQIPSATIEQVLTDLLASLAKS